MIEQASPSLRCYEVEQAAHALRHRLALASSHKRSPIPSSVANFVQREDKMTQTTSSNSSQSSTSPESVHTPQPIISSFTVQGLGIGLPSKSDNIQAPSYISAQESEEILMKDESAPSKDQGLQNDSKPSLYDVIFGPTYGRVALPGVKASLKSSSSPPIVQQQKSPHVRQGSSAFLEQVALSPQGNMLSSHFTSTEYPPSPRNFSQEFTPHLSSLTSPSRRWDSLPDSTIFDAPNHFLSHESHHNPNDSYGSLKHKTPKMGSTTGKHRRMRSSGGSVLPNGHPASSLAQDLGIATGAARPARSRNASAAGRMIGGFSSHPSKHDREEGDSNMLAGFVLASLSSESNGNGETKVSPTRSSKFVDPNTLTPRRKQRNSVGDLHTPTSSHLSTPSSTPRRQSLANHHIQRSSPIHEMDEAGSNEAAHSLLDLASSPSPSPSQFRRSSSIFPGHTPSLRDDLIAHRRMEAARSPRMTNSIRSAGAVKYKLMDDIDRHEARGKLSELRGILKTPSHRANSARAGRGHARTGSLGSHGVTDGGSPIRASFKTEMQSASMMKPIQPTTPPTGIFDLSPSPRRHARTPSQAGRVRLMSPPITPPNSNEVSLTGKTEQAARSDAVSHRTKRSSSPVSPLHSHKFVHEGRSSSSNLDIEMDSIEENEVSQDMNEKEKQEVPSLPHKEATVQTPRTPPPLPETPRTPKAPGSNFSYGDFLHVSPSPQPKMRGTWTGLGTPNSSKLPSAAGVLGYAHDQTPTRATKSRARFLDFDQSESGNALVKQMNKPNEDQQQYQHPRPTHQGDAVNGLGLGGAFIDDADNDESEQMLVPGKRIATTPKSNPNEVGKRFRVAQV